MTMVGEIVRAAFRESNLIGEMAYPSPLQAREALADLNAIFASAYGNAVGERLEDWQLENIDRCPDTAHPFPNRRLLAPEAAMVVYLPCRPQDGARIGIVDPLARLAGAPVTLDAQGAAIEGAASLVLDQDRTKRDWMYRADLGEWVKISSVIFADDMPFPEEFDAMFKIALAMRVNPHYGKTLDPQSVQVMTQGRRDFINRYLQSAPLEIDDSISWPFMSVQTYGNGRSFSSTRSFGRGFVRG